MTMDESEKPLDEMRAEIDRIDAALQDLIQRRAGVVEAIAAAKARLPGVAGVAFHPAREAQILRRLVTDNRGPLPATSMALIWRTLIGVFLRFQTPLSIALCGGDDPLGFQDLVRAHFGAALPIRIHDGADQVVGAVARDDQVIGVLPLPLDDEPSPWWPTLANEDTSTPRIVARLPFVDVVGAANPGAAALVLAQAPPCRSGADTTFVVITTDDAVSRTGLVEWLNRSGQAAVTIDSRCQTSPGGAWLHLARIPGYLETGAEILDPLCEVSDGVVTRIVSVGGFPDPIRVTGEERS